MQVHEWKQVVIKELMAREENGAWKLVDQPPGKNTLGCKLIFTVKHNADDTIYKYKACLVAK